MASNPQHPHPCHGTKPWLPALAQAPHWFRRAFLTSSCLKPPRSPNQSPATWDTDPWLRRPQPSMGNQNQMAPRRAFLAPEVMSCKSHWWPEILLEGPEPRPELSQGAAAMTSRMPAETTYGRVPGEPQACLPEVAVLLTTKHCQVQVVPRPCSFLHME